MFKKIVIITLVVLVLAGCAATGGATKLGLGHDISISSMSTDATMDAAAKIVTDTVIAAVTVDSNGKVVGINIDDAQITLAVDKTGKLTTDKATAFKTKDELGPDYGMVKYGGSKYEWNEQVAFLETWMVGKTATQIAAMKTKDGEEGKIVDEADLVGKVSITVPTFLKVVDEAIKNAK
jgi:hypothetical protein